MTKLEEEIERKLNDIEDRILHRSEQNEISDKEFMQGMVAVERLRTLIT